MVLMIALVQQEKLLLTLVKTNFCLSLRYNGDETYLNVNKTKICKFKANENISWYNLCRGRVSNNFTKDEQSEISLYSTVYDF